MSSAKGHLSHPIRNILWISLEDTSPRFGCQGDPLSLTPNIDAFAASGRLYENAFTTAPVCAPARCAIITGMYAAAIGAQHMRTTTESPKTHRHIPAYECVPPPHVRLLPEYLRQRGFFCSNNGKTDYQFEAPFTAWDEQGHAAHWRNRRSDQPFFAVFNLAATHESGMWESGNPPETNPENVPLPPYLPDTPVVRRAVARQYDNLVRMDQRVGEILGQLEEDGLADNTAVFLWSDHGEGLPRAKRWLYDSGLRVPLVARIPGLTHPGERTKALATTIDLAPTALALLDIPLPAHLQGRPFLGCESAPREYVFATRDRYDEYYDCQRAARDERFKYIRTYHPEQAGAFFHIYHARHPAMQEIWRLRSEGALPAGTEVFFQHPRPPEELYDTESDPWEMNNLAADPHYQKDLVRLRETLDAWQTSTGDLYRECEDEMARRFWPDFRQPHTMAPIWAAYDDQNCGTIIASKYTLEAPCFLMLHSPTQGAVMGWRYETDPEGFWRPNAGPIELPAGRHFLTAKAARIGYRESAGSPIEILVTPAVAKH